MLDCVYEFLKKNEFPMEDAEREIVEVLLADMNEGLENPGAADEDMSFTWMKVPETGVRCERVIVIDAGGTNFRSCLVSFDADGKAQISDFKKSAMPGVTREYSKAEFFAAIADNIDYLKNKAERIGFCFSYSMTITEDGDGIPNAFSKEIKASEVVGCRVGAELKAELEKRGWKIGHIALLNDTVAALLAGAEGNGGAGAAGGECAGAGGAGAAGGECAGTGGAGATGGVLAGTGGAPGADFSTGGSAGVKYSSYVGFILGTGMNGAYIQPEVTFGTGGIGTSGALAGAHGTRHISKQIVVCESGKTGKFKRSVFDRRLDEASQHPGDYRLEKCCSGAYLGPLASVVLKAACDEPGLLSERTAAAFKELFEGERMENKGPARGSGNTGNGGNGGNAGNGGAKGRALSLIEMDSFLHAPFARGVVADCIASDADRNVVYELFDALIDRCAWYAAGILCACVVQSGEGHEASRPVCLLCNGTTFYKTHHLKSRIEGYLELLLTKERGLYFEVVSKENDITLGTAIAGLTSLL